MKKILVLFVCLFSLQTVVRADNDRPITVAQLPAAAQQFIKKYFADVNVAFAKRGKRLLQDLVRSVVRQR